MKISFDYSMDCVYIVETYQPRVIPFEIGMTGDPQGRRISDPLVFLTIHDVAAYLGRPLERLSFSSVSQKMSHHDPVKKLNYTIYKVKPMPSVNQKPAATSREKNHYGE